MIPLSRLIRCMLKLRQILLNRRPLVQPINICTEKQGDKSKLSQTGEKKRYYIPIYARSEYVLQNKEEKLTRMREK